MYASHEDLALEGVVAVVVVVVAVVNVGDVVAVADVVVVAINDLKASMLIESTSKKKNLSLRLKYCLQRGVWDEAP